MRPVARVLPVFLQASVREALIERRLAEAIAEAGSAAPEARSSDRRAVLAEAG